MRARTYTDLTKFVKKILRSAKSKNYLCDHIVLKNDEKWWSNHYSIIIITYFRSFPSVAEGAFDDQLTYVRVLCLIFLGAGSVFGQALARALGLWPFLVRAASAT